MAIEHLVREKEGRRRRREQLRAAAQLRHPPDFIIIGAQKGGTTSLYRYLTELPNVGGATKKEVHFFDRAFDKGMDWYLNHFPERDTFAVVGESSPSYLFFPEVPGRVRELLPETKLIVLLRNPVDRAYSHFHMRSRLRVQTETFEQALDEEFARIDSRGELPGPERGQHAYLARGLYYEQLRRWLAVFPREQLLILHSERFFRRPEEGLSAALAFLGLPTTLPVSFEAHNSAEYSDMRPETRARLAEFFAPHNRRLYDLLEWDLGWESCAAPT